MSGLFKTPRLPDPPKPIRMPIQEDPEITAAAQRGTTAALRRQGRLSTILTDQLRDTAGSMVGSSGKKLGA